MPHEGKLEFVRARAIAQAGMMVAARAECLTGDTRCHYGLLHPGAAGLRHMQKTGVGQYQHNIFPVFKRLRTADTAAVQRLP
jgi:hypothetical protein